MSPEVLSQMSLIGGILIMGIGVNLLEIGKIKVGDLLPAIFLPLLLELVTKGFAVVG